MNDAVPTRSARHAAWGRLASPPQRLLPFHWRHDPVPAEPGSVLPYGLGRSYGDSCLNSRGALLNTSALNHLLAFDPRSGVLRAEAGLSLAELIDVVLPKGFFPPVTPGTKYVTLGGAIANDVHGKNHHRAGTFGRHVRRFELLRSDGRRVECSPDSNAELYRATIGGLGLTGLITWAEVQLKPVASAMIDTETIPFQGVGEFFTLAAESDRAFEYTVAWIDCSSTGRNFARGAFMRGNHASSSLTEHHLPEGKLHDPLLAVPSTFPDLALNPLTVRAFNTAYYHLQRRRAGPGRQGFDAFFYPLDAVGGWNRIYGKRGFYQYQFVLPTESQAAVKDILERIARSGMGSFLAVLKVFGDQPSPGLLSFPRAGVTLALDFPNQGRKTLELFNELDVMVLSFGGRAYPAKDARMSAMTFQRMYPNWKALTPHIDPRFASDFWTRVTQQETRS